MRTNRENEVTEEANQDADNRHLNAARQREEAQKTGETSGETAQAQHNHQPEVEKQSQGLNETQMPAKPVAEDAVRERRMADEFTLSTPEVTLDYMAGRSSDFMRAVKAEAYEHVYAAERRLCQLIVCIGNVEVFDPYGEWWLPFCVDDLCFVIEYRGGYIREYALMPSAPLPPGDKPKEPKRTRGQKRPPPTFIGPRRRARRDDGDAQGQRAAAADVKQKRQTKKAPRLGAAKSRKKKGSDEAKRIVSDVLEFAARAMTELDLRIGQIEHHLRQQWSEIEPQLRYSFDDAKHICGNAIASRGRVVAYFVQLPRAIARFAKSIQTELTPRSEFALETFGASGSLEACDAGRSIFPQIRINSLKWRQPPIPWAEYLFGVDWTLNPFGVLEEEQAFT